MDIDMEMKIVHCNNPEENPIPKWLQKKVATKAEEPHKGEKEVKAVNFPSFCRPLHGDCWKA